MSLLRRIARLRVTIGFVCGALAIGLARPTRTSLIAGAAVALAGEAVRIWAAGHLDKGREVTTSGPYRFSRHPLYLGSTLIGVGLGYASASVVVAVMVIAYLGITLTAAVRTEEAHLTDKFGGAYPAYRAGRAEGVQRRFSLARAVRNREYRAVLGLLFVLAVFAWKAHAVLRRAWRATLAPRLVRGYNRCLAGWLAGPPWAGRAVSSVGRAPALHAGCHRFESCTAHQPSLAFGELRLASQPSLVMQAKVARAVRASAGRPDFARVVSERASSRRAKTAITLAGS